MGIIDVGLRVVRGPDWRWSDQDGGEGHVGTIVEIGKPGSQTTPDRTVVVQWDSGSRTNYRTGYQNAYDLRLVDNAPAGVKHQNHICDCCKKQGISGIRWNCVKCFDFDLCTSCYMGDKHDLVHPFLRYELSSSQGVDVGQRRGLQKTQCLGIFAGAKVVRGQDWDWGNQDGGEGKCGRVTEIRGWDNESGRSVASVTWGCGNTNVYRVGHKGKMDIKYIQPAAHGFLYMQHLPIVGKTEEGAASLLQSSNAQTTSYSPFFVGERVRVCVTIEQLKSMQEGHGGWNQKMTEIIDKVGIVHRITDKGDVRVQYEGFQNRWTLHPRSLSRVKLFCPGDVVTVIADADRVKELQKGHGEWVELMRGLCDKTGVISKVYPDGDLRVDIGEKIWTLNPLCVKYSSRQTNYSNTMKANERIDQAGPSVSHFATTDTTGTTSLIDELVREAAQGHEHVVVNILATNPQIVDGRSAGKTAMQVACHQGHLELVKRLISFKASLKLADEDGDTPLHYTAFGNQPEIMEVLLSKGAEIDAINKGRCSALHVAVNKQHAFCVKLLLRWKCDVNIQDSYGDTALHDAIGKDSVEILEMLGNSNRLNLILKNKRGFNVLHHAALKGNNFATEKLVERARQFVDIRKDDGFAALHLAALNGHKQVAETLLTVGQADPNLTNNKRQTPLLLAVSQGHFELLETLVQHGADVNAADEDGETALHLALQRQLTNPAPPENLTPIFTKIVGDLVRVGLEGAISLAMACYLIEKGANISAVNSKRKTALDFVSDPAALDVLTTYTDQAAASRNTSARLDMDMKALDLAADILRSEVNENESNAATSSRISASTPSSPAHKRVNEETHDVNIEDPDSQEKLSEQNGSCIICLDAPPTIVFKPCGHTIACEDCSHRLKKCLQCYQVITSKVTLDGRGITSRARQPSAERLRYLESKIAEIEEAHSCSICMERGRSIVFLCGHGACVVCAPPLKACHMCRRPITRKINVY